MNFSFGHGGSRDGAGRKSKWMLNGQPLETTHVRVPKCVPKEKIEEWIRDYLRALETDN